MAERLEPLEVVGVLVAVAVVNVGRYPPHPSMSRTVARRGLGDG